MSVERWKYIPGWEGFYEASDLGRVRSIKRMSRVNSKTPERKRLMGGNIRNQKPCANGYLHVSLTANGARKKVGVHKAVLMAFVGMPTNGQVTRHLNGNPSDNRLENLCWGTHLENMQDRMRHGNYLTGEKHIMAKLTQEHVDYIRNSPKTGKSIAEEIGISTTQVSRIRRFQSWKAAA